MSELQKLKDKNATLRKSVQQEKARLEAAKRRFKNKRLRYKKMLEYMLGNHRAAVEIARTAENVLLYGKLVGKIEPLTSRIEDVLLDLEVE